MTMITKSRTKVIRLSYRDDVGSKNVQFSDEMRPMQGMACERKADVAARAVERRVWAIAPRVLHQPYPGEDSRAAYNKYLCAAARGCSAA